MDSALQKQKSLKKFIKVQRSKGTQADAPIHEIRGILKRMTSEPNRRVKFVTDSADDNILNDSRIELFNQSKDSEKNHGLRVLVPWSGSELSNNKKSNPRHEESPEPKKSK